MGVKISGCTVHFCDDSYDTGPIVVQRRSPSRITIPSTRSRLACSQKNAERFPTQSRFMPKAVSSLTADAFESQTDRDGPLWGTQTTSQQQLIETRQTDRFSTRKWLRMADSSQLAPIPCPVTDRLDHSGPSLGLVVDQLRSVTTQRRHFGIELVGNVHDQAGTFDNSQVDTEVIQDPGRVKRLATNIRLCQFAPKSRILNQLCCSRVVGVRIFPVGSEQQPGPHLTENGRDRAAVK